MTAYAVNRVREVLAQSFIENFDPDIFVAIGTGNPDWDNQQTFTGAFAVAPTNTLDVGDDNITTVVVKSSDESVTYVEGQDYSVNLSTGVVTRDADGSIADGATVKVFYYLSKIPLLSQVDLIDEIGRKRASVISYVTPDEDGDITVDSGVYSLSVTRTKHILCKVTFTDTEAVGSTIREFGVFVNCELEAGLPGGQVYFEPADVAEVGDGIVFKNTNPISKDTVGEVSQSFVITI